MLCIKNYDCKIPQLMRSPTIMFTTYLKIKWRWIKVNRKEDFPFHWCYDICFAELKVISMILAIHLDKTSPYNLCDFYLFLSLSCKQESHSVGREKGRILNYVSEWALVWYQALVVRGISSYSFFCVGLGLTLGRCALRSATSCLSDDGSSCCLPRKIHRAETKDADAWSIKSESWGRTRASVL